LAVGAVGTVGRFAAAMHYAARYRPRSVDLPDRCAEDNR
jgi:hypothetical protein